MSRRVWKVVPLGDSSLLLWYGMVCSRKRCMPKPKDLVGRVLVKLSNFKPDVRGHSSLAPTANNPKRPDHGTKVWKIFHSVDQPKYSHLDNLSNIRSASDSLVTRYQSTTKGGFHLSEQTSNLPSIFSSITLGFSGTKPITPNSTSRCAHHSLFAESSDGYGCCPRLPQKRPFSLDP